MAELEGKVVVWDWHYGNQEPGTMGPVYKELDRRFMEMYPGVEIEHVGQPFEGYSDVVRAALAGGSGPDAVMFLPAGTLLSFSDALLPLDGYITDDMKTDRQGFADTSVGGNPENDTFALPMGFSGNVWYYNKALFEQAGLDPENPPTTYAELLVAAQALADAGVVPFAGGNQEGFVAFWIWSMLWPGNATAEQAVQLADGTMDWDDPVVLETTDMMLNLFNTYWDPGYASAPLFTGSSIELFKTGGAAMFPGLASGPAASYVEFNEALGEENVGVMHVTGTGEPNYLPFGASQVWSITQQADDPELVFEYIKFITNQAASQLAYDEAGMIPNHVGVVIPDDAPAQIQEFIDGIQQWGAAIWPHGLWGAELFEWAAQVQDILAGNCTVAECYSVVQQIRDQNL